MIDLVVAKKEFDNYTKDYDKSDSDILLKYNHSFRVSDLCIKIATNLQLNYEDIQLAGLIGLLHDIGRFEQQKLYGTFNDSKSIDHGFFACMLLFDHGLIRKFINDKTFDHVIKKAIFSHNKDDILEGYNERELLFTNILRDADKIDVLGIVARDEYQCENVGDVLSDKTIESIMHDQMVPNNVVKTRFDYFFYILSYIYDINYKYSFMLVKNDDLINKIISIFDDNSEIIDQLRTKINAFIDKKGGVNNVR